MVIRSQKEVDLTKIKIDEHPYWAPITVYIADNCMKAYALKLLRVYHEIPSTIAKGSLIHSLLEKRRFWKEREGVLVPHYKSPESFAAVAGGNWKAVRRDGKSTNSRRAAERENAKTISWRNEAERWSSKTLEDVMHMARIAYRTEVERGPPVVTEVNFEVFLDHQTLPDVLKGLKLKGKIDYIRAPLVLGDHKTGYAYAEGNFFKKNFQLIHYALSTWQALQDKNTLLSKKILPAYASIPLDDFLELAELEINHIPSTTWIEPSERPEKSKVYSTKIKLNDTIEFGRILRRLEDAIAQRRFTAKADKKDCHKCFYGGLCDSFDMEEIFTNEYEKLNPLFAFGGIGPNEFGRPEKFKKTNWKQTTLRLM